MEVVASLSQGRTAAAQCGLFTHKSFPVIFDPPSAYKSHTEARANNLFYCEKAKSVKYSACVFAVLTQQHAERIRRNPVTCGLCWSAIFIHIIP